MKRPNDGMNALQRYQAKCDSITIRPKKADGERIRSSAVKLGFESTTKFIMAAIEEYLKNHADEMK